MVGTFRGAGSYRQKGADMLRALKNLISGNPETVQSCSNCSKHRAGECRAISPRVHRDSKGVWGRKWPTVEPGDWCADWGQK